MAQESPLTKYNNRMWIGLSFAASVFFTICNSFIVELSNNVGPFAIFYFASGAVFSGLVHNFIEAFNSKREGGPFWNDQNLIVDGKIAWKNILAFLAFCCLFFVV